VEISFFFVLCRSARILDSLEPRYKRLIIYGLLDENDL